MAYAIICKNCDTLSINDWEGFCSISCCCDYAHRHSISLEAAKRPNYDEHVFTEGHPCAGDDLHECTVKELERWYDDALEVNGALEESNKKLRNSLLEAKEEIIELKENIVDLSAVIKEWSEHSDRFILLDL